MAFGVMDNKEKLTTALNSATQGVTAAVNSKAALQQQIDALTLENTALKAQIVELQAAAIDDAQVAQAQGVADGLQQAFSFT